MGGNIQRAAGFPIAEQQQLYGFYLIQSNVLILLHRQLLSHICLRYPLVWSCTHDRTFRTRFYPNSNNTSSNCYSSDDPNFLKSS